MKRVVLAGLLVLAACGGKTDAEESQERMGEAICADLAGGLTMVQLYRSVQDHYSAQEFAARVSIWVEDECPAQLKTNDGLRTFLDGWGLDPDNLPD